eukprot:scaffold62851_cov25-Tisochrysis_lutea.AAC.1
MGERLHVHPAKQGSTSGWLGVFGGTIGEPCFVQKRMDVPSAGRDQPQADQPNTLANGHPPLHLLLQLSCPCRQVHQAMIEAGFEIDSFENCHAMHTETLVSKADPPFLWH